MISMLAHIPLWHAPFVGDQNAGIVRFDSTRRGEIRNHAYARGRRVCHDGLMSAEGVMGSCLDLAQPCMSISLCSTQIKSTPASLMPANKWDLHRAAPIGY